MLCVSNCQECGRLFLLKPWHQGYYCPCCWVGVLEEHRAVKRAQMDLEHEVFEQHRRSTCGTT